MTEIKRYEMEKEYSLDINVIPVEDHDGSFVRYDDHAAIVAALQEQVRDLAEFKDKVRQSFLIGDAAEDFAVFTNIGNTLRRSGCLSAVEREFFTREVPDEEDPDEMFELCDLSWGAEPKEYIEDFRKALREIRAQAVEGFSAAVRGGHAEADRLKDLGRRYASVIRSGEQP